MIYFDSKHLSHKLGINKAKWKRWSREFLPPDPLGGLQSGVARQFNVKEAFKVYLGGYLVSELKFTIPDALQILADLSTWLKLNGFFSIQSQPRNHLSQQDQRHHIYIYRPSKKSFAYCIRTIMSLLSIDNHLKQEIFSEAVISTEADLIASGEVKSAQLLAITVLYQDFLRRIGIG
ncbi:MAG: hypothetical protein C4519_11870 [Desulfobacteraceae bacterium]|nr:MAG: hypothetical protein C4519_11870 [Desulfobacteraceae bacterium]